MLIALALALLATPQDATPATVPVDSALLTVAERSEFRATATSAEVIELLEKIVARSQVMHLGEMAKSTEGKSLPLVVLANPLVTTPAEMHAAKKPIVFVFGNIHAGEVCGKEALLMLVRELATTPDHPLLDHVILLVAPNYNPDGNDKMDPGNRPGQVGPELGMGQRPNGMGLDLNRDWIKAEAPETQGFLRVLTEYDPHLVIDTHTTDGSEHQYTQTFSAPNNPTGHRPSIDFVRDTLLPTVSERLEARTGYKTCFYGDFDRRRTTWSTYSSDPRFGCPYRGLRGQLSILLEAYAYASFEDRVLCTREFVREILGYVIEKREEINALHYLAQMDTVRAAKKLEPSDLIGLRYQMAAYPRPVVRHGWAYEDGENGRPRRTDTPQDYTVVHNGRFEPTLSVRRPYAYILEPGLDAVVAKLRQHGIQVEPFTGSASTETYLVTGVERARRAFQGHNMLTLEVEATDATTAFVDASIVYLAQPLGNLAAYMLEPQATDGLAAWNILDEHVAEGKLFPIHRVLRPRDLE